MYFRKMKTWFHSVHLSDYYYLLVFFGYILTLFVTQMRPGIFATMLMLIVILELILKRELTVKSTLDWLVVSYLGYNLLSFIWLKNNGYPASVFFQEFSNSILPIVFYFVGTSAGVRTKDFYKKYLYALSVICILGLILYIMAPQFYLDYLLDWEYTSKADVQTMRVRMNSVMGSTLLGFLAAVGIPVSSYFIMEKKDRLFGMIMLVMSLVFAFLSNQRSAMVVAILAVLYVNHLIFFEFKPIKQKYFVVECATALLAVIGLCIISLSSVQKIYYRLASLPSAIGERSEDWFEALNHMASIWLGNGLGANGHKALSIEFAHVITDGGLVKVFCEEGILGFSIFLCILILVTLGGFKQFKYCYADLCIIAITLLQSIGSNILSFQLAVPIFWFALGHISGIKQEKDIYCEQD